MLYYHQNICRKCKRFKARSEDKQLCEDCFSTFVAVLICKILFSILHMGMVVMFILGIIALTGIISINLGGAITMVVIGSIFGALPIINAIFKKNK